MRVNEGETSEAMTFFQKCNKAIDNTPLMKEGIPPMTTQTYPPVMDCHEGRDADANKKLSKLPLPLTTKI